MTTTQRNSLTGPLLILVIIAVILSLVGLVVTGGQTTPVPTQADDLIAAQAISLVASGSSWQPSDVPAGVSTYFVNGPDNNGNSTYAVPVTRGGVGVVVCLSIARPYNGSTVVPCPSITKILSEWTPGDV